MMAAMGMPKLETGPQKSTGARQSFCARTKGAELGDTELLAPKEDVRVEQT